MKILKQRTKWRSLQGETSAEYVFAHKDASMQATEQDLAEHVDFTKIEEMNLYRWVIAHGRLRLIDALLRGNRVRSLLKIVFGENVMFATSPVLAGSRQM